MMKYIFYVILLTVCITSCGQNDLMFDERPNIYFEGDSTIFSWLGTQKQEETVYLPCKLVGQAPSSKLKFKVEVLTEESSAQEGLHYQKIPEYFEWPADSFSYNIPIIISQKDVHLSERFFRLKVRLIGTEELLVNYTGNTEYVLQMGALVVKPVYWDQYTISAFFGPYSKKKHTIIVQLAGRDFPETSKDYKKEIAYWQNFGVGELNSYFKENAVFDENGDKIEPWIN